MQAVLNSALPIFALILTGFICGYFGVFDRVATDNLNRFAVYLALPSLMFVAMSKITPDQVRQFGFVAAFCGGFAVSFAVAFTISRFRGRRVANASIEGLDAGYSNVGFMGIPMCLLVFGPESAPASIIATLFTACVLFLFAVILVEIDLQKAGRFWSTGARVMGSVLRSPLLIAPVAGLAVGDDFQRYAFVDARRFAPSTVERSGIEGRIEREYENLIFVDPLVAFARQRAHDGGSAGVKIEFAPSFDRLPGDRFERRIEREAAALPGRQNRVSAPRAGS